MTPDDCSFYTFTLQLHRSVSSPQRGSAAGLHQGWWWGVVLVNTPQQAVSYTLESGVKTKYVFTVCVSSHPCVVVFSLWFSRACSLSLSHRCTAEGPCSIPLEHYMKEISKTTCTTARGHTPSRTALPTKVTFTRTGERLHHSFNVFWKEPRPSGVSKWLYSKGVL